MVLISLGTTEHSQAPSNCLIKSLRAEVSDSKILNGALLGHLEKALCKGVVYLINPQGHSPSS